MVNGNLQDLVPRCQEAVQLYQSFDLEAESPDKKHLLYNYSISLDWLALAKRQLQETSQALEYAKKSVEVLDRLNSKYAGVVQYAFRLARARLRYGLQIADSEEKDRLAKAKEQYLEAARLLRTLPDDPEQWPEIYRERFHARLQLASSMFFASEFTEVEEQFRSLNADLTIAMEKDPLNIELISRQLSCTVGLAKTLAHNNKFEQAVEKGKYLVELGRSLWKANWFSWGDCDRDVRSCGPQNV